MKTDQANDVLNLQAGQHWKTEKNNVEIVRVGKLVAQYRFVTNHKKTSIKVEDVTVIQNYLSKNRGTLV
jgi:hypothetical protein